MPIATAPRPRSPAALRSTGVQYFFNDQAPNVYPIRPFLRFAGAATIESSGGSIDVVSVNNHREELSVHQESAVLVCVALPGRPWLGDDPLDELRGLANTAGARVVGELLQKRDHVVPGTYIGKGKVEELIALVQSSDADVVIFDNDLSPAQVRSLEKATNIKVIDRS